MSAIRGAYAYHYAADPPPLPGSWRSEDGRAVAVGSSARDERAVLLAADGGLPDAAVLLDAYAREGEGMLRQLGGAWRLVLWDARAACMLLARGATGSAGLFYEDDGWTLRWSDAPAPQARTLPPDSFLRVAPLGVGRPRALTAPGTGRTASTNHRRILALVTDGYGGYGGIAQYNRDLFDAIGGTDYTLSILPRYGGGEVPAVQHPAQPRRSAYVRAALAQAVLRTPPDWVFCGHLYTAPLAALVARARGARLWLQLHGIEVWQPPGWAIRTAVRQADLVTAVSRDTRRRFLEWSGVAPERVRVLPNTIDPVFAPGAAPALRERLGLAGRRIVLTVSRIAATEQYKGHYEILQALARLPDDVAWLVVGEGDGRAALESAARAAGLESRVRFAGRIGDGELPEYYRAADVFALPSRGEGFGIVFLQAAASGLPVIAADAGGAPDALAEGRLGRLLQDWSPATLAAAIDAALAQPRGDGVAASRFARAPFRYHLRGLLEEFSA